MRRIRNMLGVALLLLTTGCSNYSLQELRSTPPKGTPFQASLALHYLQFAEEEAALYDWIDSGYFADKGLHAAYGNDVSPESLTNWDLPERALPELTQARNALMTALTPETLAAKPKEAAAAQFYFDCWVENAEENWQWDEISYCRDQFQQAMRVLAPEPEDMLAGEREEDALLEEEPAEPTPQKEAYIVFFGMNRDALDEQGERIVDGVVKNLNDYNAEDYTVVLNGHTDTVASKRYNAELSMRRAQSVLEALVARGVPRILIRAFGFGETDPLVPTPDNAPEPKNRRVEIYIGDQ